MESLKTILQGMRNIAFANDIKIKKGWADFVATRIVQSSGEPDLMKFSEKFAGLLNAGLNKLKFDNFSEFLEVANSDDGHGILTWIREHPKIAAMIVTLKEQESFDQCCEMINVNFAKDDKGKGKALPQGNHDINVSFMTLSPLAHGGDVKAGNATLFRRCKVMTDTGNLLELPFYGGGAFRGQMRDMLANHFLTSLGIRPNKTDPPVALWFFHAMYAGGALEENSVQAKAIGAKTGNSGISKLSGLAEFRYHVPPLSVLGSALGNRIIEGCVNFNDFVPSCTEWGTGERSVHEILDWHFLTRREDHEGHDQGEHSGMIANTECICAGARFTSGIDYRPHISDLEKSLIGMGLSLMAGHGYVGAENRRGFGNVRIEQEKAESGDVYDEFLQENKEVIVKYLGEIKALL